MNAKRDVFTITYTGVDPIRLDKFLAEAMPDQSRSRIQDLIKSGKVHIDSSLVEKPSFLLAEACEITVVVPEAQASDLVPEDIPLDILFEDENVIAVNKKAGMVVHPSHGHQTGTLVHALLAHNPFLQGIGGVQRPGIVHRLDRDTSGVILIAKNEQTHRWLQDQFRKRQVRKEYRALVDGHPPTPTGRIEIGIQRDPTKRKKMAVAYGSRGRMAITEYEQIKAFSEHTYLSVRIHTGRTHQIRVHLSHLNCPIVADTVYGYKHPSLQVGRQFLHAYSISIRLPGASSATTFTADLPIDLQEILDQLT